MREGRTGWSGGARERHRLQIGTQSSRFLRSISGDVGGRVEGSGVVRHLLRWATRLAWMPAAVVDAQQQSWGIEWGAIGRGRAATDNSEFSNSAGLGLRMQTPMPQLIRPAAQWLAVDKRSLPWIPQLQADDRPLMIGSASGGRDWWRRPTYMQSLRATRGQTHIGCSSCAILGGW